MNKQELANILDSLGISEINEGIQNDTSTNTFPRIVYSENIWDEISASDESYSTEVSYQISFFSRYPRHAKLMELRKKLIDNGKKPSWYHEVVSENGAFIHSTCVVSVVENLDE